jgi:hypothetical protein
LTQLLCITQTSEILAQRRSLLHHGVNLSS